MMNRHGCGFEDGRRKSNFDCVVEMMIVYMEKQGEERRENDVSYFEASFSKRNINIRVG